MNRERSTQAPRARAVTEGDEREAVRLAHLAGPALEEAVAAGARPEDLQAMVFVVDGQSSVYVSTVEAARAYAAQVPPEPFVAEFLALAPVPGATWCVVGRLNAPPVSVLLRRCKLAARGGAA